MTTARKKTAMNELQAADQLMTPAISLNPSAAMPAAYDTHSHAML